MENAKSSYLSSRKGIHKSCLWPDSLATDWRYRMHENNAKPTKGVWSLLGRTEIRRGGHYHIQHRSQVPLSVKRETEGGAKGGSLAQWTVATSVPEGVSERPALPPPYDRRESGVACVCVSV